MFSRDFNGRAIDFLDISLLIFRFIRHVVFGASTCTKTTGNRNKCFRFSLSLNGRVTFKNGFYFRTKSTFSSVFRYSIIRAISVSIGSLVSPVRRSRKVF